MEPINENTEHMIRCATCGHPFDARDLNEVILHEHLEENVNKVSHFISQKKGGHKQWVNGKDEIELN